MYGEDNRTLKQDGRHTTLTNWFNPRLSKHLTFKRGHFDTQKKLETHVKYSEWGNFLLDNEDKFQKCGFHAFTP